MGRHGGAVTEGSKFIKRRKFTVIGGMRACRHTRSFAENDIKPQNFTSSVTSCQLLLEEKPISRTFASTLGEDGEAVTEGLKFYQVYVKPLSHLRRQLPYRGACVPPSAISNRETSPCRAVCPHTAVGNIKPQDFTSQGGVPSKQLPNFTAFL